MTTYNTLIKEHNKNKDDIVGINSQLAERSNEIINLSDKRWNVQGDGITDDSIEIQKIIDYAELNNKSIKSSKMTYLLKSPLLIKKKSVIDFGFSTILYEGVDVAIKCVGESTDNYISPFLKNAFIIKKGIDYIGTGLYLESCVFSKYENIEIRGFEIGLLHSKNELKKWAYLNTFNMLNVINNKIGIKCVENSNGVVFDKVRIFGNKQCGAYLQGCYSTKLINGEIEANGNIETGGTGVIIDGGECNSIINNYIEANGNVNDLESIAILVDNINSSLYEGKAVQTIIRDNHISASGRKTVIKVKKARTINITGNNFHYGNPPEVDIDVSECSDLNNSIIQGNTPSSKGVIKTPQYLTTATIQHGTTLIPNLVNIINILSNYVNTISNGNFENDLTDWVGSDGATIDMSKYFSGIKSLKISKNGSCLVRHSTASIINHKYYVSAMFNGEIMGVSQCIIQFSGVNILLNNTILNKWIKSSKIITSTSNNASLYIGTTSGNNIINYDNVLLVDLTAVFGEGKEPSIEWCDMNLVFK